MNRWHALPMLAVAVLSATPASAREAAAKTTFVVVIENVSTPDTLRSSSGATAPAPNSPGLWVVHTAKRVVFARGKVDRGLGLERQAEEGNPAALHDSIQRMHGIVSSGTFATPVGDDMAGPALPGKSYRIVLEASPGQRLTLTTMFGQSNDLFYAPSEDGIPLWEKGRPLSGDITSRLFLWDAGTEVNEEPGFGPSQAPRQSAPDTGAPEHAPVRLVEEVNDGFHYPSVQQVLRVTITPDPAAGLAAAN